MRERSSMEEYANWKAPDTARESASDYLRQRETTLFEKMRRSGTDLARVLAFITAFSVMTERGAFAKGDQPVPPPEKPKSSEQADVLKPVDAEKIHRPYGTSAQEGNIAFSVDSKTLQILNRLDMSIEGNRIIPLRDPQHCLTYIEENGVTTDSVSITSEISGSDSTIAFTGKNSDGSVDVLRYVNGKFSSVESTAADSTGQPAYGK